MGEDKSPEEIAFANSVIVKEIFKNLEQSFDSKEFRPVNNFIWRETLGIWRKRRKLVIEDNSDFPFDSNPFTFQKLFQFYSNWEVELASLSIHPYHHVKIDATLSPFLNRSKTCEKFFWRGFGPHITHLELSGCHFRGDFGSTSGLKLIKQILIKTCPLLESLKIESCTQEEDNVDYDSEEEKNEKVELYGENEGKTAKGLTSLHLDNSNFINMTFCRRILRLTPNLKNVSIEDNELGKINSRVFAMLTKHKIKIETYTVTNDKPFGTLLSPFTPLLSYVKAFPDSISELHLKAKLGDSNGLRLNVNAAMYEAIGLCQNLKILTLAYAVGTEIDWYRNLEGISLENLKSLRVQFHYLVDSTLETIKFDFGMLKGMPKLIDLRIWHVNQKGNDQIRKTESKDWLFQEEHSEESVEDEERPPPWVGSETLKTLFFKGWNLTENDIQLLQFWFPGLTSFGAYLSPDTPLSLVLDLWKGTLQKFLVFDYKGELQPPAEFQEQLEASRIKHPNVFITTACP